MPESVHERNDIARALIEKGSGLAAGAAAGAIAFLAHDPVTGAAVGAGGVAVTQVIAKLGAELNRRYLGEREEVRVGAALAFAIDKIRQNRDEGRRVREDGFFEEQAWERAPAEEIVEGLLRAAQREHEERKVRYYGRLLGNIPFHPEVSREEANVLIRYGEALSYQQLQLLSLFAHGDRFPLRTEDYRGQGDFEPRLVAVLQEVFDLHRRALLNLPNDTLLGLPDVRPAGMVVQGVGASLHNLMELWEIDRAELEGLAELLS